MDLSRYQGRIFLSLVFGALVMLGLLIYGDFPATMAAISRFKGEFLPAILGLTLANYFIRFVKWHYYIRLLGARNVGIGDSMMIFFSGLSMTVTPGKVGEWLKIYLLRSTSGVSFSRAAPIVLAERLTDGLALIILATAGILLFGLGIETFIGTIVMAVVIIGLSQYPPLAHWIMDQLEKISFIGPRVHLLRDFFEGSRILFAPGPLTIALVLGVTSWAGECYAFALVLQALGVEPSPILVLQSAFILAVSTLAGALLLTPGGLGVAEGGLTGLTQVLIGVTPDVAAASTILIRACTLWYGVAVGALALMALSFRPLAKVPMPEPADSLVPAKTKPA